MPASRNERHSIDTPLIRHAVLAHNQSAEVRRSISTIKVRTSDIFGCHQSSPLLPRPSEPRPSRGATLKPCDRAPLLKPYEGEPHYLFHRLGKRFLRNVMIAGGNFVAIEHRTVIAIPSQVDHGEYSHFLRGQHGFASG